MERVTCGDKIVVQVFCVTVRGNDPLTGVECVVHTADKVALEQVIRVKYEISLKALDAVVSLDLLEQKLQGKALGGVFLVKSFVADSTSCTGDLCRIVIAVVRNHENCDQLLGVVLHFDAFDKVADDGGLVSRGDHNCVFM